MEQERALVQILVADPKTALLKSCWQGTEVMESVVSALKPISVLIDILSGEEQVIASCLKPLLNHLHSEALAEKEGESEDTALKSDIQHRVREYMKRKYKDDGSVKSTLNISCCLDPRFMLKNYSDEEAFVARQSIVQQGVIIVRQMEEQHPPGDEKGIESSQSTDASCSLRREDW